MKRLELVIENGDLAGKRFAVPAGGVRLGRSSANDIHIPDEELSRNHCLFEPVGEAGVRVTDLASANGTIVNGTALEAAPVELKAGDVVEVGGTVLRVVGDEPQPPPAAGNIDLGLGAKESEAAVPGAAQTARRRSPIANLLWAAVVVFAGAAIYLVLNAPSSEPVERPVALTDEEPVVKEIYYEKVEADLEGIFRYEMAVSADATIRVSIDDTKENRHPSIPPRKLSEQAMKELNDILDLKLLREFDREYVGAEPDVPALTSWRLRVVYTTAARSVKIVNTQEPEAFKVIREKLEAFSKNELGIHAIQYSKSKLIALAKEAIELGQRRWEDRDVQHGNLFGAIGAFREAIFYLDTIDPKPECIVEARQGLERATDELKKRYADQRFLADRAINLGQWDSARKELSVLIEMVPDRTDDRNREASAKLVDVEKRMKKGGR